MNTKLYSVFKDVVITREPDRHSVPITYTQDTHVSLCFCLQSHINMTGLYRPGRLLGLFENIDHTCVDEKNRCVRYPCISSKIFFCSILNIIFI